MKRRGESYVSITDVVATVYCERKVVLDWTHGKKRPIGVQARALSGSLGHKQFEYQGAMRAAVDRRCFIATHLYGGDAEQTWALRAWRDEVLMPTRAGRLLARAYYAVSPFVVRAMDRSPWLGRCLRPLLRALIDGLWFRGRT